ncbi:hypothetical protein E4U41_004623 [Claviceps citrina]|nr:hypothetical protein E4U41_004623 [Claviceps citrina]
MAHFMGIHRFSEPFYRDRGHVEPSTERANIAQCLQHLSCSSSWWCGIHPGLSPHVHGALVSSFDCHDSADRCSDLLAFIERQVFQLAYSPAADPSKDCDLKASIMCLQKRLDEWWHEFGHGRNLAEEPPAGEASWLTSMPFTWLERAIRFHTLRILMIWATSDALRDSDGLVLVDARCCLRLWTEVPNSVQDVGGFAHVARYVDQAPVPDLASENCSPNATHVPSLLVAYPPVAPMQLLFSLVQRARAAAAWNSSSTVLSNVEGDLVLLGRFQRDVLEVVDLGLEPDSPIAQLTKFTKVLHDVAVAIGSSASSDTLMFGGTSWAMAGSRGTLFDEGAAQGGLDFRSSAQSLMEGRPKKGATELDLDTLEHPISEDALTPSINFHFDMNEMGDEFFNDMASADVP